VTQIRAVTALLSTFVAVQAVGQAASGTLRGRVSDTRGHTVGGAQLLLYIGNRAEVRATAVSDHLGQFEFIHLAPASDYRLRVTHAGYVSIEAAGISLRGRRGNCKSRWLAASTIKRSDRRQYRGCATAGAHTAGTRTGIGQSRDAHPRSRRNGGHVWIVSGQRQPRAVQHLYRQRHE